MTISKKNLNRHPIQITKISNKEMSETSEITYRKAHWEGKNGIACCLNIPKQYVERMGLDKQSYLKVTYLQDEQMLMIQKLVEGGHIEYK